MSITAPLPQSEATWSPEDLRPFFATVDCLKWLDHQAKNERATLTKDSPSIYKVSKLLSNSFFALTFDAQGEWVLAAYNMPAMQWFSQVPWGKVKLQDKRGALLSLLCPPQIVPACEPLGFGGGQVPAFGVNFQIARRMLPMMANDDTLRVGLFEIESQGTVRVTKAGASIALECRPSERR